jgi:hypothetical protein
MVDKALQIAELGGRAMMGQHHSRKSTAGRRMHVMQLLTPLSDVLIIWGGLGIIIRRAVGTRRQLLLIAVAGLNSLCRLSYCTVAFCVCLLLKSMVGLLVSV